MGTRRVGHRLLGVVLLVALVGMGSAAGAAQLREFNLFLIPGSQSFVYFVMEQQKFAEKYGVKPRVTKVLSPPASHTAIVERKSDMAWAGFVSMAIARSQGHRLLVVHAMVSPQNLMLARKDSPLKSMAELRGKKVGIFGGPGATTTQILAVVMKRWHGLDLFKDVQVVTAPSPALAALLDKGEIPAALVGDVDSVKLIATGKYRALLDLTEEWEQKVGRPPLHVALTVHEEFAEKNPETIRGFIRAYLDTIAYIRAHPETWEHYGKEIKLPDREAVELMRQRMGPRLNTVWDEKTIEAQTRFLEYVIDVTGGKPLAKVPPGLMTTRFAQ
ncbi:MAG: ABC transporter substrate-binding protein [Deltaproteobacteria bacterium]|nr:ABC transporter substrate-binding protein [Deltaproteobacteria bacterium]MBI3077612.1 ABC transporter substrate-binding protein [Deltaproteobacteria bacterium]